MVDPITNRASTVGWLNAISRRVREREIQRQMLYNQVRKVSVRHIHLGNFLADRLPTLLPEFLKMLMGSLLAFWIIGKLLGYVFHAGPLYTFAVFGLIYSVQATYYKYRLSVDQATKSPSADASVIEMAIQKGC